MSQPEMMYRLQEIDLNRLRIYRRVKEIDALLGNDETVRSAQQQVEVAQKQLSPLRAKARDLELEIQSTTEKSKSTEDSLYSGSVTNPKELQDMQQEVTSLKKWHGELEERLLQTMEQVEAAESELKSAETSLRETIEAQGESSQELLEERRALKAEFDAAEEQREVVVQEIIPENVELYLSMRKRKANKPLALLQEEACGACGTGQNLAVIREVERGKEIIYCDNCGRILVYRG